MRKIMFLFIVVYAILCAVSIQKVHADGIDLTNVFHKKHIADASYIVGMVALYMDWKTTRYNQARGAHETGWLANLTSDRPSSGETNIYFIGLGGVLTAINYYAPDRYRFPISLGFAIVHGEAAAVNISYGAKLW